MNNQQSNVLVLPPKPPAPVNTVLWAVASVMLSIGSSLIHYSNFKFPPNAFFEAGFAIISSFSLFLVASILGIRAVINETKRNQYRYVVTRYTSMTGDKRYLPYILPVHLKAVTVLFVISMIISFGFFIFVVFGGLP